MGAGLRETPLRPIEEGLGARFEEFNGWYTPLLYSSISSEALAVRSAAGAFDVSHMGRLFLNSEELGRAAPLFTNNVESTKLGKMKYSYILDEKGTIIDDVVGYGLKGGVMLVVNASAFEKDVAWMRSHGVNPVDVTEGTAMIAVQGPSSPSIARELGYELGDWFTFKPLAGWESPWSGGIVSRSGYTGEDGFELIGDVNLVSSVFRRVIEMGAKPAGLGARDVLRLEAGYTLSGVDTVGMTPLDLGGSHFVKWEREFIGKGPLEEKRKEGEKLPAGFLSSGGIPRRGYACEEAFVSSGTFSPTLKKGIGLLMPSRAGITLEPNADITLYEDGDPAKKALKGKIVSLPFVPHRYPHRTR